MPQVTLLQHHVNLGKGRALKTAFNYYLNYFPDGIGVVTADGDGQHAPEDIIKCVERLRHSPEALILGVRDFSGKDVPLRSRVGNKITRTILKWAIGAPISDTQTGLRGIPRWFLKQILPLKGERFEFETSMLVAGKEAQIGTQYGDAEVLEKIEKLLEALDDMDDVQNVYHNGNLPEDEEEDE